METETREKLVKLGRTNDRQKNELCEKSNRRQKKEETTTNYYALIEFPAGLPSDFGTFAPQKEEVCRVP